MSPVNNQLAEMIGCLPEEELLLLLEIARRFVPDDLATPDDLAAIETARNEYAAGETLSHDAMDWD